MKNIILLTIVILFIGCADNKESKTVQITRTEKKEIVDTLEFFVDSINFGQKQNNKIEVYKIGTNDSTFAEIFLYERNSKKWKLKDSLILPAVRINDLETEVKDFNNDNYKDIIFTTGSAARGGNIVQTLILYTPKNKSLNRIKNSESYPNLMYNEKLNCIDACILTGGQTTYFLKIKNDSLKEFANVDQRDGRITSEIIDSKGNWKEIKSIKDEPESFDRFINYNPIEKRK